MASSLRRLLKLNLGFTSILFPKYNFMNVGVRYLYLDRDLGILTYENTRFAYRNQFLTIEDTFRAKMKEVCQSESGTVFTEDIKAIMHLAHPSQEDMNLVTEMIKKYVNSKTSTQFGTFIFGPILMRMFYYLNEPKSALTLFKDPNLIENFNYSSAIRTLMCLLYKHEMYDDVIDVFNVTSERLGPELAARCSILLYAACLKLNTPESTKIALEYWKLFSARTMQSSRASCIVAYLLLSHGSPNEALEILSTVDKQNILCIKNLKILIYAHMNNYLSIIPLLKSLMDFTEDRRRQCIFEEVLQKLEESIRKHTSPEADQIMSTIGQIRQADLVETDKSLLDYLLRPLLVKHAFERSQSRQRESAFNRKIKTYY